MATRAYSVLTMTNQSLPYSHPKIVWQKRRWVYNQERVSVDDDLCANQPRDYWLCVQKVVVVVIRWCALCMAFVREKIRFYRNWSSKGLREEIFANVCNIWTSLMYNYFDIIHGPFSRFENTGLTWTRMENLMSQSLQQWFKDTGTDCKTAYFNF